MIIEHHWQMIIEEIMTEDILDELDCFKTSVEISDESIQSGLFSTTFG